MRDKRAKFVELANNRVNRAIKDLRLVGNLANKATYDYTDEEAKKIVRTLQREVDLLKARFNDTGVGSEFNFSL